MFQTTILICDDNISVHESLTVYLNAAGMDVISVYDGSHVIEEIQVHTIDLVILDIMMPGKFGTDVCQDIRKISDIPILMLSARGDEEDRVSGLLMGADDYVAKPFSPREVVARVNNILKRVKPGGSEEVLVFSDLKLYPASYKAFIQNTPLDLTPKEFDVLHCLLTHPNRVQSRDLILDEVWGSDYFGDTRAVDTIIKRLRNKLDHSGAHLMLRSVYGIGYMIEEREKRRLS